MVLASFAGSCGTSGSSDRDRIGVRKGIGLRNGAFTGGWVGYCLAKGKAYGREMRAGHSLA